MVVTDVDVEKALIVVSDFNGRHSDLILRKFQKVFDCGPVRAGNVLKHLVKNNHVYIKGFRVWR